MTPDPNVSAHEHVGGAITHLTTVAIASMRINGMGDSVKASVIFDVDGAKDSALFCGEVSLEEAYRKLGLMIERQQQAAKDAELAIQRVKQQ
jgi:hypothetical protein